MAENTHESSNDNIKKTSNNRMRNFHFRYLELCRSKNFPPVHDIKAKNNEHFILDFVGDKLRADDWLLIIESLYFDQTLNRIGIRMRKNYGHVLDNFDTDKKARQLKHKPVIFTKFVFSGLIESISNNIKCNQNLSTLVLEALTLDETYILTIIKAISSNDSLKTISFARSIIGDAGCEAICTTFKYLLNIENVNLSQCQITVQGASYITDMIKFQKIYRYTEGWKKSLRYREVNTETIPGLRSIQMGNNPAIGDKGTEMITEILKEDVWIKEIDMSNCGITDVGGKCILECLEINTFIQDFKIKGNPEISVQVLRNIYVQLGQEDERDSEKNKKNKLSIPKIRERVKMLEEQIEMEKNLRKQVENLNEQLHSQIICYERQLTEQQHNRVEVVKEGFIMISKEALNMLVKERDNFKNALSAVKLTKSRNNFKKVSRIRKAKSETKYVEIIKKRNNNTKSEHVFKGDMAPKGNIYIEKNMGDTPLTKSVLKKNCPSPRSKMHNHHHIINNNNQLLCNNQLLTSSDSSSDMQINGKLSMNSSKESAPKNKVTNFKGIEEALRLFVKKKQNQDYPTNIPVGL